MLEGFGLPDIIFGMKKNVVLLVILSFFMFGLVQSSSKFTIYIIKYIPLVIRFQAI